MIITAYFFLNFFLISACIFEFGGDRSAGVATPPPPSVGKILPIMIILAISHFQRFLMNKKGATNPLRPLQQQKESRYKNPFYRP